jgi:CBS domain-containing protein
MVAFLTLKVADAMATELVTVPAATTLAQARELFERYRYNALPVVDDRKLAGWVTQFDLLNAFTLKTDSIMPPYALILKQPVSVIMQREPEYVDPTLPLNRVLLRMIETRHRSFPVVADGLLVGIIAREDILQGLQAELAGG